MARYTKEEIQEAAIELVDALTKATVNGVKPTVYASVKHVSRSGMSRRIDFWVIDTFAYTPYLRKISRQIATLTGSALTDDGVKVSGCGMDMGWHLLDSARCVAKNDGAGRPYESKTDQISPHYL